MSVIAVITTLPNREQALQLARSLVARRLVACAQLDAIESVYLWDGQLQQEPEVRLTLKAPESHYETIKAEILERHPYDLPAIHAMRLDRLHEPYGDWITAVTGKRASSAGSTGS